MGGTTPKQFLQIDGREILARTLEAFEHCAVITEIWVIVAAEQCAWCHEAIVQRYGFHKVRGVVAGGVTRQESVWRGLQRVAETVEMVVVHDGVRPFVTACLVHQTLASASRHGAAIAAVPLKDTLKRVSEAGTVEDTVPRERLWRVQTPQAFQSALLRAAFEHAWRQGIEATDEAGLIEALGHPVQVVPGYEHNVKITTPDDLIFCATLLRSRT